MFWPQHMTIQGAHVTQTSYIVKIKLKSKTHLCINADNLIGNKIYKGFDLHRLHPNIFTSSQISVL